MSAKVEIKKGSDGKFYAHRKAANGKVTHPSQGYTRKPAAVKWAERTFPDTRIVDLTL